VKHYSTGGQCDAGWNGAGINPCNTKYTYASACWYLYKVDGIDACPESLLARLRVLFLGSGWFSARLLDPAADDPRTFNVTDNLMGLVYINKVANARGYTALANATASDIRSSIEWLFNWQSKFPFGGWMHSYNGHEGAGTPGQDDHLMFSPWQSSILAGALWRAWDAGFTDDTCGTGNVPCIPTMLVNYAMGMETYGWIDNPTQYEDYGWMHDSNLSRMIAWYVATPEEFPVQLQVQNSDGYYSDEHDPELQCVAAMGYYFSSDPDEKAALKARYDTLQKYYTGAMATVNEPARIMAWNHSHNPSCEWFMEQ